MIIFKEIIQRFLERFWLRINCITLQILGRKLSVSCWLILHPQIEENIQWELPGGGLRGFPLWSRTQRRQLYEAYALAEQGSSIFTADPLPNIATLADDDFPITVLSETHAWELYLSYIANTLYLEMNGILGWSILDYSGEVLETILNSKYFFDWGEDYNGYGITRLPPYQGEPARGNSIPAPPNYTFNFLIDNDLIGQTRLDTIGRVIEWCRQNLTHFSGSLTAQNAEAHWQYRGYPPVSRIIEGARFSGSEDPMIYHYTAGCHGTNGFLNDVLKAVNISVLYLRPQNVGHATPFFVTDGLYLSHGDDPYNRFAKGNPPPYPSQELLIDATRYLSWFNSALSADERNRNIGRQVYELALVYLPNYLLSLYCNDVAAGLPHSSGSVFQSFERWYTVQELEDMNLWTRLEQKVTSLGGCENIN